MRHLPMILKHDAGTGEWTAAWDEAHLLTTSVQGGRHLLGALNLEVIFVGAPKGGRVPPECEAQVPLMMVVVALH